MCTNRDTSIDDGAVRWKLSQVRNSCNAASARADRNLEYRPKHCEIAGGSDKKPGETGKCNKAADHHKKEDVQIVRMCGQLKMISSTYDNGKIGRAHV